MAKIAIDFEWPVCDGGYEIVTPPDRTKGHSKSVKVLYAPEPVIRAKAAKVRLHRPLEIHAALFRQFAALGDNPAAYVEFANAFGRLTNDVFESVAFWRSDVSALRAACQSWELNARRLISDDYLNESLAKISAVLRPGQPDGKPVLKLVPHTLRSALWLQFAQFVSSGAEVKACEFCGSWFEVGGDTGKRITSRFCSDAHRTAFHNREKARAKS